VDSTICTALSRVDDGNMRDRRINSSGGREVGNAGHRVSAVLDGRGAAQGDKQLALKYNEQNINLLD
jgi:hypothetical protein